jgi:GTP-binding protein LepA
MNKNYQYLTSNRLEMLFELPLSEVIYDFYDKLKTVTQGYGSFDYEIIEYRPSELVKLDILINGERVDALSQLVHEDRAYMRARLACDKLKDEIPRQQFKIAIQGAIGGNIISRSTVCLPQGCHSQVLRRRHHPQAQTCWRKQKKGKKRMKMVGR